MDPVEKLNDALSAALLFLGGGDSESAKARLRDILVEEISFVDRAANRRRFLVVKQRGGAPMEKTEKQDLTIPGPVKDGLLRVVTEALERLVGVSNEIKSAEPGTERSAEPLPPAIANELSTISDLLRGALSRYPSPVSKEAGVDVQTETKPVEKAEGPVSQALRSFGEVAMSLAAKAAEAPEIGADIIGAVRELAAQLNSLVEKYPSPTTAAAPPTAEVAPAEKAAEPPAPESAPAILETVEAAAPTSEALPIAEPAAAAPAEKSDGGSVAPVAAAAPAAVELAEAIRQDPGSETGDKLRALAAAMTRIAEAPTPDALAGIVTEMMGVAKSIGAQPEPAEKRAAEIEPAVPPRPAGDIGVGVGPASDKPNVQAQDELSTVVKRLETKVESLAGTPMPPASRPEPAPATSKPVVNGTRRGSSRGGPWVL